MNETEGVHSGILNRLSLDNRKAVSIEYQYKAQSIVRTRYESLLPPDVDYFFDLWVVYCSFWR